METSQIPQILSGSFLKQEQFCNGGLGVDDVVIFQIWLILKKDSVKSFFCKKLTFSEAWNS